MAQGDGISKKSERKIRTMKRILVISWYFPPINSSEGLVTYKLLKNSKYQYDVCRTAMIPGLMERTSSSLSVGM